MNNTKSLTSITWTGTHSTPSFNKLRDIGVECSDFINDSHNHPLLKLNETVSPSILKGIYKVKVRHKKSLNPTLTEIYNSAFTENIRERAVFVYSDDKIFNDTQETFYVFPKNGYKFLYSKEVIQSNQVYKEVLDSLLENLDHEKAYTIITDMLKFSYISTNLKEGIKAGAEIILYNIPYYYAISTKVYPSYKQLLKQIHEEV